MSLRIKTLALIGFTLTAAVLILYVVSRTLLLDSFVALEAQHTRENMQRVLNAIAGELTAMGSSSGDWANWDETRDFLLGDHPDYVETNMVASTFQNLSLNVIALTDLEGNIRYSGAYDLETGEDLPLPEDLETLLAPGTVLTSLGDESRAITGILVIDGQPALVAARPVLDNNAEGPSAGTLFFARFLSPEKIQALSNSVEVALSLDTYDSSTLPADVAAVKDRLTPENTITVEPLSPTAIGGYALLTDLNGEPAALLRAEMPRDIFRQGWDTITYFIIAMLLIGVVFGLVIVFIVERFVLSRMWQLTGAVSRIRSSGDPSARISIPGNDELAQLGSAINGMLAALADTQKSVTESEHQLQTVVNNAPVTLWALDSGGTVKFLRGRELESLGVHPTNVDLDTNVYRSVLPLIEHSRRALVNKEDSNKILYVNGRVFDTRCALVRERDGNINGIIGIAIDMTEKKHIEDELQETIERLEKQSQQNQRVREFFLATLEQMNSTIKLGATRGELLNYLDAVQAEFNRSSDLKPEKPKE